MSFLSLNFLRFYLTFLLTVFGFGHSLYGQVSSIQKPLLKDFPDQGFSQMTQGDYFTLEKDEFLFHLIDGLPHFYSQSQFEQLLQKLRLELKELYFFSYLTWNVSNGGFSYFYDSGYGYMIPEIKKFYERIGEEKGLEILEKAEVWYQNRPKEEVWVDVTLDALDQEFNSNKTALDSKVEAYVRANSHLYVRDENGEIFTQTFSGKAYTFDPLTQGTKEVELKNNKKEGSMKIHSPEGILLKELNYQNGVQVGLQRYFDDNGTLDREEVLFAGSEIKEIRYYHPNGQLSYQGKEGPNYKKMGSQTYWYENGTVKYSYLMDENGNHTGPYFEFYPDGSKMLEVDRRGVEPEYINFWDENGIQHLKEGTGEYFYEYSYDGDTSSYEYHFVDYKKHGAQKEFRNGVLVKYTEMNHGEFEGYHREFYPNGRLKEEYLMSANNVVSHRSQKRFENPVLRVKIETQENESWIKTLEFEPSDTYPILLNRDEVKDQIKLPLEVFDLYPVEMKFGANYLLHINSKGEVTGHNFSSADNGYVSRAVEELFPSLEFAPGKKGGKPVDSYLGFRVSLWLEESKPLP